MPGPWDRWAPRNGPHNRAARALAEAGQRVVEHSESGTVRRKGQLTGATTYRYDCGCRRFYVIEYADGTDREVYRPCAAHRNLLTPDGDQATMGLSPAGKAPEPQQGEPR